MTTFATFIRRPFMVPPKARRALRKIASFLFPSSFSAQPSASFGLQGKPINTTNLYAYCRSMGRSDDLLLINYLSGSSTTTLRTLLRSFSLFGQRDTAWLAALSPRWAYLNLGKQRNGDLANTLSISASHLNQHISTLGTTGRGRSQFIANLLLARGTIHPCRVDQIGDIMPWSIGVDEDLGPTHPLVAIAFFGALAEAEANREENPSSFEQAAHLLGRALSGESSALDGIDASWMDSIETSQWVVTQAPHLFKAASLVAATLVERSHIDEQALLASIGPSEGPARRRRL